MADSETPLVGIIMGSTSDWETMKPAADIFEKFSVPHECRAMSAHRTPELTSEYARTAAERGVEVIIAGAGGAAHLPGVVAACTDLPVLGVPVKSAALMGLDSLLSMAQMPGGVPVGTMGIGSSGAKNAALLTVRILANSRPELRKKLAEFNQEQADRVLKQTHIPDR